TPMRTASQSILRPIMSLCRSRLVSFVEASPTPAVSTLSRSSELGPSEAGRRSRLYPRRRPVIYSFEAGRGLGRVLLADLGGGDLWLRVEGPWLRDMSWYACWRCHRSLWLMQASSRCQSPPTCLQP